MDSWLGVTSINNGLVRLNGVIVLDIIDRGNWGVIRLSIDAILCICKCNFGAISGIGLWLPWVKLLLCSYQVIENVIVWASGLFIIDLWLMWVFRLVVTLCIGILRGVDLRSLIFRFEFAKFCCLILDCIFRLLYISWLFHFVRVDKRVQSRTVGCIIQKLIWNITLLYLNFTLFSGMMLFGFRRNQIFNFWSRLLQMNSWSFNLNRCLSNFLSAFIADNLFWWGD